jgi:hypothetical protein
VRLWAHDLSIAMGAVLFGELIYAALEQMFWFTAMRPVDGVVGAFAGIIIYLVASPFIYRSFKMSPMWHPRCPSCRDAKRFWAYSTKKPNWPREQIRCSNCGTDVELWYEGAPSSESSANSSRGFALLWPQSLGRWQRLDKS